MEPEKMKRLKIKFEMAFGYVLAAVLGSGVVILPAPVQGEDEAIHVCVDSGGELWQIPLDATSPNGMQSLYLKLAGGPDLDPNKPKPNPANLTPADQAILDNLNRRLK